MMQVIRKGIQEIIVDEVPDPPLAPHHALIRPVVSLISSGTEAASIHQRGLLREVADNPSHVRRVWEAAKANGPTRTLAEVRAKFSEYAVLGYSGAGVVVAKHPTVRDLEAGQRVAYGGEGTGHGEVIAAGRNLIARVPDGVLLEHACFTALGSIALHAVRVAEIGVGDTVAVIGLGLVGQLITQLARLQGGRIIAIDLKPERVDLARRLGAPHGVAGGSGAREAVAAVTNGLGADCVIVAAAAKSSAPSLLALDLCRDRGRMVVVGSVEINLPWEQMFRKEVQLRMSRAYGPGSYDPAYEKESVDYPAAYVRWTENRNMEEFLRLVEHGQVQLAPLISHRFPLEAAPSAYRTVLEGAPETLAVLLEYKAGAAGDSRPKRRVEVRPSAPGRQELGVSLIGAGVQARWAFLPFLKDMARVKLRGIHSSSGARGKSLALRFGAAYCTSDPEEIWNDPQTHVVILTSRNQYHASQAIAALRAGKHVFVEKPMALTLDECQRLCQAVEETGLQLSVGFNRRFAPCYLQLKELLARRAGPAVLHCRVNSPGISGSYWMADPAAGGAIVGEACHFVDLMYWLLESEPVRVGAFSLPVGLKDPVGENNLTASFQFADGSIGNLTYCTVGSRTSGGERVEAFAPGMGAWTEDMKRFCAQTSLRRYKRSWWPEKGYGAQLKAFLDGIREGRPPAVTVRDGARSTVVCLKMLEAARAGEPRPTDWEVLTSWPGGAQTADHESSIAARPADSSV